MQDIYGIYFRRQLHIRRKMSPPSPNKLLANDIEAFELLDQLARILQTLTRSCQIWIRASEGLSETNYCLLDELNDCVAVECSLYLPTH